MPHGNSDENQSMLNYHSVNYTKVTNIKDTCEDIQNNNNSAENGAFTDEDVIARYSSNSRGILAQCLVTGAVFLLAVGAGMPIGYSAILLPQLSESNGSMRIDRELGSWIASVHSLATPIGALTSGPLLDTFGRRSCLQLSAIPLCLGWIVMGLATNISSVLTARLVCGFAVGFMTLPSQVLVGEMADPGLRGFLLNGSFAAYCFGILLIYALGAAFSWPTVAFCGMVFPGLALIALLFVPESPAWLVRRGKMESARKALLWLRGGDVEQVNAEMAILTARATADIGRKSMNSSLSQQISSAVAKVFHLAVLKPLLIINVFNVLQLFCGTYIIVFYAVDLVKDIGGGKVDNYLAAVVTALIRFLFCLVACVLILKTGRRFLGIFSATGTALASLVLAGYMFFRTEDSPVDSYVLGICVLTYVGANTVGLLTLPGMMAGELLPQRARGIGGGFTIFFYNLEVFTVAKCFPMMNKAVGISGVFTIFGTCALLEAIFIYLALPETKNRTLQQIEDYFEEKNILWVTRNKQRKKEEMFIDANA